MHLMHTTNRSLILLSSLAGILFGAAPVSAQTYSNPLDTPGFTMRRYTPADPGVIEFEGMYYMYPTLDGRTYKVMWSDDLVHWSGDRAAFTIPRESLWKHTGLWAPEVERINGRFYLYYTAGTGDIAGQRIGVADSGTPTGPFVDRSVERPLIAESCIDAECFQDGPDLYFYYVRHTGPPFKLSVWVRRMLDPFTLDPASEPRLCTEPVEQWEASVNEGPTVVKRDGRYYLFYSAWGASSPNYALGVAVADHPLGPWTKQPQPFNPVLKRNDAIKLWGPGHGQNAIGPDGLSDWYVYHTKINPRDNYERQIALDRLVPVGRYGSRGLRFMSSGGTTGPTPAPRRAYEFSNFEDGVLPRTFVAESGNWAVQDGKLLAPANGSLAIQRRLSADNLQDFQFQWWVRGVSASTPADGFIEFSFAAAQDGKASRPAFQMIPASRQVRFVEIGESSVVHATASYEPATDWKAYSVPVTIAKSDRQWRVAMGTETILTADQRADLGERAWIRTKDMPIVLDGYRQTLVCGDDFESERDSRDLWAWHRGKWACTAPAEADDGFLVQTDDSSVSKLAIMNRLSLAEFDLEADFMPVASDGKPARNGKHGLVHNYDNTNSYAMACIDAASGKLMTAAMIKGKLQEWMTASVPLPATAAVDDYHKISVTTDRDKGEFVYCVNGTEMMRRAYPGLPASGRAGLICEGCKLRVDNVRFSGSPTKTE